MARGIARLPRRRGERGSTCRAIAGSGPLPGAGVFRLVIAIPGGLLRRRRLSVGILWRLCGKSVDFLTPALSVHILFDEDP